MTQAQLDRYPNLLSCFWVPLLLYHTNSIFELKQQVMEKFENIEQGYVPPHPLMKPPTPSATPQPTDPVLIQMIAQLVDSINELRYSVNSQIFCSLTSTPEEREVIKARIHRQEGKKMDGS